MAEKKLTKKELAEKNAMAEKRLVTAKEIMKVTGATFFEDGGEYGYELGSQIASSEDFEIVRAATPYMAMLGLTKWFFDGKV